VSVRKNSTSCPSPSRHPARNTYGPVWTGAYHRLTRNHAIDVDKLDPEQRLQLIGDLWDSLRARPESVHLTRAQEQELDCRLDSLDRGTTEVVTWDEEKRRLRG
jgi:putative addiction module component (TIGR02574 family)